MSASITIESEVKQGWDESQLRNALAQLGYGQAKNPGCKEFPAHFKSSLDKLKNQQAQSEQKAIGTNSALAAAPTDDDVLTIAEQSNIDIDVVMQAAANCETLRLLVLWAEEYQRQKAEIEEEKVIEDIRESVKRRIELEKLTGTEQQLQERLLSALTPSTNSRPSVASIEKMLGIETPESVRKLAKSSYSGDKAPDFLSQARELLKATTK